MRHPALALRIARSRPAAWPLLLALVTLAVASGVALAWRPAFPALTLTPAHVWLAFAVVGGALAALGVALAARQLQRRAAAEVQLRAAYAELDANHRKLLAFHDLEQQVARADSEAGLLELAAAAPLKLADACASTIVSFDDDTNRLRLDVAWGLSAGYVAALRHQIGAGIDATRCRECVALKTTAGADCPLFAGLQPLAAQEGIASAVCAPLVQGADRVGAVVAYFPSTVGPSDHQIRLLTTFQTGIGAAIERRRLRLRELEAFQSLDRVGHTAPTLDQFAAQVLDATLAGWGVQAGVLFRCDDDTWTAQASRGLGDDLAAPGFRLALHLAQEARAAASPLIVSSLPLTPEYPFQSAAAVPLVADGQRLGALVLAATHPLVFEDAHADVLISLAGQAALALRNAELHAQVRQLAVFEERYRLGREIHDGLAQTLAYLGLQTERVETLLQRGRVDEAGREVAELRQSVRAAYVDAREAIDGLRLRVEGPSDLAAQLRAYVADFARQSGLAADFSAAPDGLAVDAETAVQLLRITQEALTNVRKHAEARHVVVRLTGDDADVELTVTDDGRGLPTAPAGERVYRRHGLASMRERAETLGGTLSIVTGAGQGTRVIVSVPRRGAP